MTALPDVPGLSLDHWHGQPLLRIATPACTAAVSLFGGQLLSFVPAGQQDLLWLSPLAKAPPAPIRGGVPVCWPWFGRQDQPDTAPAHGLARTAVWTVAAAECRDETVHLVLDAPAFPGWPLALRMELQLGRALEQRLVTVNRGDAPVRVSQALHSYFRVGDALQVDVQGVDGLEYLDKFEGYAHRHRQHGDWNLRDAHDPGRSDRIYLGAAGRYVLRDPILGRCIALATAGSHSLVAWNPGETGAAAMADVGSGWRSYVCLEAANAGPDAIVLAPGTHHVLAQRIELQPLA